MGDISALPERFRKLWAIIAAAAFLVLALYTWKGLRQGWFDWGPMLMPCSTLTLAAAQLIDARQRVIYRVLLGVTLGFVILSVVLFVV